MIRDATTIATSKRSKELRWYHRNRDIVSERLKKRGWPAQKKWLRTHPEARLLAVVKCRAKRKGLPFNLERDDIIIPELCPYLGLRLTPGWGDGNGPTAMSLDRIDNSKGYIKGNVEVISSLANVMKNSATPEQLRAFALAVLRRWP